MSVSERKAPSAAAIPVMNRTHVSCTINGDPADFLCDDDQHPRVKRHMDLVAEELERVGAPALQVDTAGDSRLERVLSAVLLGDLVSVYMAVLAGVDPTPVPAIDRLKKQL